MSALQEVIEAEIARLADENGGRVTPEAVVELAHDPGHPLHEEFEWDDSEAGRLYRLQQARTLIRSVRVEIRTETLRLSTIAYVHDPSLPNNEQGYVNLSKIDDAELKRRALNAELKRVGSASERAREIANVLGIPDIDSRLMAAVG